MESTRSLCIRRSSLDNVPARTAARFAGAHVTKGAGEKNNCYSNGGRAKPTLHASTSLYASIIESRNSGPSSAYAGAVPAPGPAKGAAGACEKTGPGACAKGGADPAAGGPTPLWKGPAGCCPRIAGAVCASAGAIIVDCCTTGGGGIVCVIIAGMGIEAGCGTGTAFM